MGGICEDIPSSLLRRPVKINIYKRSRVIVNTLDDDEPNPVGQDGGEVKDEDEDEIEIENKNEDKIEVEYSQRN